ncbi:MAG: DinB family protein [Phycisphaerales bacterium JB040]
MSDLNHEGLLSRFERFPSVLQAVAVGVDGENARWRPPAPEGARESKFGGGWSIVEIVAHLADEEEADFSVRLKSTLENPSEAWPAIDPEGWALERDYRSRSLTGELSRFGIERANNLVWLRELNEETDWDRAYEHPKLGRIRAGDLLSAWCAHDWLHLRQIARRMYQLTQRDSGGYSTSYAGEW